MYGNKGDKVVLGECLRLSVLLKMNADQLHLRTDTGGLASICVFRSYSGTIVARILYHISY